MDRREMNTYVKCNIPSVQANTNRSDWFDCFLLPTPAAGNQCMSVAYVSLGNFTTCCGNRWQLLDHSHYKLISM